MLLPSYVLGPIFLILGFIFSLVTVVGAKVIIFSVNEKLKNRFNKQNVILDIPKSSPKKPRRHKTAKSIELNTDEIDRIYFRKIS